MASFWPSCGRADEGSEPTEASVRIQRAPSRGDTSRQILFSGVKRM